MEQLSHGEFKKSYDCLKGAERLVKIGGYIEDQKAKANKEALGATTGLDQVVDEVAQEDDQEDDVDDMYSTNTFGNTLRKMQQTVNDEQKFKMLALTYNNLGCYYKRCKKANVSLKYMK